MILERIFHTILLPQEVALVQAVWHVRPVRDSTSTSTYHLFYFLRLTTPSLRPFYPFYLIAVVHERRSFVIHLRLGYV